MNNLMVIFLQGYISLPNMIVSIHIEYTVYTLNIFYNNNTYILGAYFKLYILSFY